MATPEQFQAVIFAVKLQHKRVVMAIEALERLEETEPAIPASDPVFGFTVPAPSSESRCSRCGSFRAPQVGGGFAPCISCTAGRFPGGWTSSKGAGNAVFTGKPDPSYQPDVPVGVNSQVEKGYTGI